MNFPTWVVVPIFSLTVFWFTCIPPTSGVVAVVNSFTWVVVLVDRHRGGLEEAHLEVLLKPEYEDLWLPVGHLRRPRRGWSALEDRVYHLNAIQLQKSRKSNCIV